MSQSIGPSNTPPASQFTDRRDSEQAAKPPGVERRQFADGHVDLSPEAEELSRAIDDYKVRHRRRFVTSEEMLTVIKSLGYQKS